MNTRQTIEQLTDLGLKWREAQVYLALLKLGQAPASQIAEAAHTPRTITYDILEGLKETGLVSTVKTKGVKQFSALSIDKFYQQRAEKMARFHEILPEIRAITAVVGDRPKVQFLEGVEGIKAAFEDTLTTLPRGGELVAYVTTSGYYENEIWHTKSYVKRRVQKKIFARGIAPTDPNINIFAANQKKELRELRLVPRERFPFANEIDIYGNKVAIMSLQGELMAVIIESESVAKTQRAIFELAWLGAKQVEVKQK